MSRLCVQAVADSDMVVPTDVFPGRFQVSLVPRRQLVLLMSLLAATCRCERGEDVPDVASNAANANVARRPVDLLVFPDWLHVDDPAVNDFVDRAMRVCASGDYEQFRLLWSARQEPLPRDEYEQGWQAVRRIAIRALEKVLLEADPDAGRQQRQTVYVLLAEVAFDPDHPAGRQQAQREAVLMLVREHDAWRLAVAPDAMRDWIKQRVAEADAPSDDPASAPAVPLTG